MGDDDLIRRGDAFSAVQAAYDDSGFEPDLADAAARIAALPAVTPAPDAAAIREAALREAAAVARHYADTDYCAMGYPEDGGIAASGTAYTIERAIAALLTEKPHDRAGGDG